MSIYKLSDLPIVSLLALVSTGVEAAELENTMEKLILYKGKVMFLRTSTFIYKMYKLEINVLKKFDYIQVTRC